ncbi:hypothetical protein DES42_105384 [Zavarzinia compransoris]|uniref:Uncharacterized protein n=1 Tax=Zavarzinia compransoris TaxID=1264899 RepID=A0A317E8V3_9PROT|nr:hypothetical protein DKG75_05990 [Zavarzinia compransoris]TDP45677.1 hypothetical protein DES42_105384 [Zavarzinia compransoris]
MANRKVKTYHTARSAPGYRVVTLREAAEVTGTEFVVVEPRLQPKPARRRAIAAAVAAVLAERREKEQAALG